MTSKGNLTYAHMDIISWGKVICPTAAFGSSYSLIIRKYGVFSRYKAKIIGLQNIGHCDLQLFSGHTLSHVTHNQKV